MERRVVLLGGTGFIGRAYAWRCAAHGLGQQLTILTRSPVRGASLRPLSCVTLVECDVNDAKNLSRAIADAQVVVNLVGILHGRDEDFQRAHIDLPLSIGELSRVYGVEHVVHVSALGAATDAPSMYLRSKAAGEAALQRSGVPLSVLRPSVVFGAEDRLLNLFAGLQAVLPVVPLAGAHARLQPVWVRDVAQALWTCVNSGPAAAGVYEAVGPGVAAAGGAGMGAGVAARAPARAHADVARQPALVAGRRRGQQPFPDAAGARDHAGLDRAGLGARRRRSRANGRSAALARRAP
jgi:uncharacterized protein YbjT (DUF2867 family)